MDKVTRLNLYNMRIGDDRRFSARDFKDVCTARATASQCTSILRDRYFSVEAKDWKSSGTVLVSCRRQILK